MFRVSSPLYRLIEKLANKNNVYSMTIKMMNKSGKYKTRIDTMWFFKNIGGEKKMRKFLACQKLKVAFLNWNDKNRQKFFCHSNCWKWKKKFLWTNVVLRINRERKHARCCWLKKNLLGTIKVLFRGMLMGTFRKRDVK